MIKDLARNLLAAADLPWGKMCNFDYAGYCKARRLDITFGHRDISPMNCCQGCNNTRGYLPRGLAKEDWENTYKPYWDEETGFWREGEGCVLPREIRSDTCVFYYCQYRDKTLWPLILSGLRDLDFRVKQCLPVDLKV